MFTNGDNMYNKAWFGTVAPIASERTELSLIAWDFVTHHVRNGLANSVISVNIARKFIDLGSVMIRSSSLYRRLDGNGSSGFGSAQKKTSITNRLNPYVVPFHRFLPQSIFTTDLFARDFHLLEMVNRTLIPSQIELIHSVLMFHQ
jgi:hypothetical protein